MNEFSSILVDWTIASLFFNKLINFKLLTNVEGVDSNMTFKLKIILLFLLLSTFVTLNFHKSVFAQEYVTVSILNPLTNDLRFIFSSEGTKINDTFTADVYIYNVSNLVAWQITLKWNNSIIHYAKAWIPEDNVFAPAIEQGATLIAPKPSVDQWTGNEYYLKYGATVLPKTQVSADKALLCKINFTIAALPSENETQIFTNLILVDKLDPLSASLDSYVILKDKPTPVRISMEPAVVRILKETPTFIFDIAVSSLSTSPNVATAGDLVKISFKLENLGNEITRFIATVKCNNVVIRNFTFTLAPGQNQTVNLNWNTTGMPLDNVETITYLGFQIPLLKVATFEISVEVSGVANEADTSNNRAQTTFKLIEKLEGMNYVRYFALLVLCSPLGQALSIYVFSICAGLIVIFGYKRLRKP